MKSKRVSIFRFYQVRPTGRVFSISTEPSKENWSIEGVVFQTLTKESNIVIPVFKYQFKAEDGELRERYSTNSELGIGKNEGISFYAFKDMFPETVPIYEFSIEDKQGPQYLLSQNDRCGSWMPLGIAFYAYPGSVK